MNAVVLLGLSVMGMLWTIASACAYQFWRWDGFGCLIAAIPGVFAFVLGAVGTVCNRE